LLSSLVVFTWSVLLVSANKYLTDQEPWKMKNQPERQRTVVRTVLEACYYFAHV
jgi:methionyl-tRNA synthetase